MLRRLFRDLFKSHILLTSIQSTSNQSRRVRHREEKGELRGQQLLIFIAGTQESVGKSAQLSTPPHSMLQTLQRRLSPVLSLCLVPKSPSDHERDLASQKRPLRTDRLEQFKPPSRSPAPPSTFVLATPPRY